MLLQTLILLQDFCFEHSLICCRNNNCLYQQLQSRGRSVAELQVTGVRANLNKRPHESTATLSVHSLLLVDALQTFGPDFELLVASHKHVR